MFAAIKSCFEKIEVNAGRQDEMDLAKGFAIIFMILAHCLETFGDHSNEIMEVVADNILGGPFSAPVFMFCMGAGICYSRKNEPVDLIKRGFSILGIGLLLNVFRYFLPAMLGLLMSGNTKYLGFSSEMYSVDILQFAGLFFLYFGWMKKRKASPLFLGIVALACSVLGALLRNVSVGNKIGDIVFGFIWGTYGGSYFPFLNWVIFPTAGYLFAKGWKYCADKKKYYNILFPISLVIMLTYLYFTVTKGFLWLSEGDYFFMGPFDAVIFLVLIQLILSACFFAARWMPVIKKSILMSMSKNINSIYCIHWTLLCFISVLLDGLFGLAYLSSPIILVVALILIFVSDLLARKWKETVKNR